MITNKDIQWEDQGGRFHPSWVSAKMLCRLRLATPTASQHGAAWFSHAQSSAKLTAASQKPSSSEHTGSTSSTSTRWDEMGWRL